MLAADVIGDELELLEWVVDGNSKLGVGSRAGSGLTEDNPFELGGKSFDGLGSNALKLRFGVLVEIGSEEPFISFVSSVFDGKLGMRLGATLANGGRALTWAMLLWGLFPPGGISSGAAWSGGLEGLGNANGGLAASGFAGAANGDGLVVVLDPKPFEGALLNMSNALAVLPAVEVSLGPIGLGVVTCWKASPNSSSTLSGVSFPFNAIQPP